ncbi:MAG: ABC transporter permease [Christensenellales bacterium]
MRLSQSLKMAVSAISANKMRSFLTTLGIIIGVFAVTVLVSVVQGTTNQVTGQMEGLGSNLLMVSIDSPRRIDITIEDVGALESEAGIEIVAPVISARITVKSDSAVMQTTVEGSNQNYGQITNLNVRNGRYISELDVEWRSATAVIGVEVADELFGNRDIVGNYMNIGGRSFKVVGLLEEKGTTMIGSQDNKIVIPITTAQRMFKQKEIGTIYASAQSNEMTQQAEAALNAWAMRKAGDEDYYSVFNQSELISIVNDVMGTLTLMMGSIAGISLLVGGIGIMNIMLVSVSERTREIGIRKAIGAKRSDIMTQFLIESVIISLLGGMIGLVAGALGISVIASVMGIEMGLTIEVALLAAGFSIFVGVVFGSYPASKASKLNPIEALRYE